MFVIVCFFLSRRECVQVFLIVCCFSGEGSWYLINPFNPATVLFMSQDRIWILSVVDIPLTGRTSPSFCSFPEQGPGFPISNVQWFEVRGCCSYCRYRWNCWSSLFILSFHKSLIITALAFVVHGCFAVDLGQVTPPRVTCLGNIFPAIDLTKSN
jgi:hypothetical protein